MSAVTEEIENDFEYGFIHQGRFIPYASLYPYTMTNFTLIEEDRVKCDDEVEKVD